MKSLFRIATTALFAALALASCLKGEGSDDPANGGNNTPAATGLQITCSTAVIKADGIDAAIFTITYNDVALTEEQVTFYDATTNLPVEMPNLTFTTESVGTYSFYIKFATEDKDGNTIEYRSKTIEITAVSSHDLNLDDNNNPGLTIALSTNIVRAGTGEAVIIPRYNGKVLTSSEIGDFSLFDASTNAPLTLEKKEFTANNGTVYLLPVYSSDKAEIINFWAMYGTESTINTPSKITVIDFDIPQRPTDPQPSNTSFRRRAFVTQFTGTWCGNCPIMHASLTNVFNYAEYANKAALIAIHQGDALEISDSDLRGANGFAVSGYPTTKVDLIYTILNYGVEDNIANIKQAINTAVSTPAQAGIAARTAIDDSSLVIRTSVKAAEEGEYFVGAWVLEDGLYEMQNNTVGISGNFDIHNNVLRLADSKASRRDFYGHPLGTLNKGDVADYLFVIELNPSWNKANCHVVLFVSTIKNGSKAITNVTTIKPLAGGVEFAYK